MRNYLFILFFIITSVVSQAQTFTEWDNPAVYELNRERAHTTGLPLADHNSSFAPEDSPYYMSLNGTWKFKWVATPSSAPTTFYQDAYNASSWEDITVPFPWQVYGIRHDKNWDKPLYVNYRYPFAYTSDYSVMASRPSDWTYNDAMSNPVGSYRRGFELPDSWENRDVFVRFNGAGHGYYVWVNGHFVGYAEDSYLPSEFNITNYLRKGNNNISVRVYRFSSGSFLECQDYWRLTGITRDVFLWSAPKQQIRDYFFRTTSLRNNNTTATASLDVELSALTAGASYNVVAQVKDGNRVIAQADKTVTASGKINMSLANISDIEPWSAEHPKLYDLTIALKQGNENIDIRGCKVGFRTISIRKDGALCVNGNRIIFHGVDRHDFSAETGRTVSREEMEQDIKLMKRLNINAVRTSHYPNNPYFYDLCDKYGIYLLAEADVECHGNMGLSDVAIFRKPMTARNVNHVLWLRNHASICLWSAGNESGGGANFKAVNDSIKKYDTTRPTHYEGNDSYFDVSSTMYASLSDIENRLKNNLNDYNSGKSVRPHIQCENTHSMGNSGGNQREYFDLYEKYPSGTGEFIWDWRDQGLRLPTTGGNGKPYFAYGGDFGDNPNDGNFCCNGVILPDGTLSAKSLNVKKVYQPVDFSLCDMDKGEFLLRSKLAHTTLDHLDFYYTILRNGLSVKEAHLDVTSIAPGESTKVNIPLELNDDAEYSIRFSARQREATWWAGKDYEVAAECIQLKASHKSPYQNTSFDALSYTKEYNTITIKAGDRTITFTKGELSSYVIGSRSVISSPLILNAFRAPTDNDKEKASMWDNYGLRKMTHTATNVKAVMADDNRSIDVSAVHTYKASNGMSFSVDIIYKVYSDGTIVTNHTITPSITGIELPRLGMSLEMEKGFEQFRWFGRGPWDSYRDRQESAFPAVYTSTVTDQWTDYVLPQETGNKEEVRWLALNDNEGKGLLFVSSGKNMAASVGHWRAKDIYTDRNRRVKHPHEVNFCETTVVNLDAYNRALGNASCGADVLTKYQIPSARTQFSFIIMPLDEVMSNEQLSVKADVASPYASPTEIADDGKGYAVLSTLTPNATIYYTIDDAEPQVYTKAVDMRMGGNIVAWCEADGYYPSIKSEYRFPLYLDKKSWRVMSFDSQQGGNEVATNLIDGNENTIWHTAWTGNVTDCPHEVVIDLGDYLTISQFIYQGRQDGSNGRVRDYEVYFSNSPKVWGSAAARGTLQNIPSKQYVDIPSKPVARYMRFIVLSTHDNNKYASAAELDVVATSRESEVEAPASVVPMTTNYYLRHVASGLYLHYYANTTNGCFGLASVTINDLSDKSFQFLFTPISGFTSYYTVKCRQPFKFCSLHSNGYDICQADVSSGKNEWFQVEQQSNGTVYLRSVARYPLYFNFDSTVRNSLVYMDKAQPTAFEIIRQSNIEQFITGIDIVEKDEETYREPVYDLQGHKLSRLQRGINIVGKSKHLVVK